MGGTTLPGLTLETAKEHTRVSCGWPDARDACKARPSIEAQGLASPDHHSPAWPHRPIKTGLLLSFFSSPPLSLFHLSLSLFISHSLPCAPSLFLPILTKRAHTFLLSHSASLIAMDLKRGMREGSEIERKRPREGESEGKGVIPPNLYGQNKLYWPLGIVETPVCGVCTGSSIQRFVYISRSRSRSH